MQGTGKKLKTQLPHITVRNTATTDNYTTPRSAPVGGFTTPERDRNAHAAKLITQLESLKSTAVDVVAQQKEFSNGVSGLYVEFISSPELALKVESLESKKSGIELCSSKQNSDSTSSATVFIPDGKLDYFLRKIIDYRDNNTKPNKNGETKPQNQPLVESISNVQQAVIESLWTDESELLPSSLDANIWWEVWVRLSDKSDNVGFFRGHAEKIGLTLNPKVVTFLDRAVILAYGNREQMTRSMLLMGIIAELRLAKEVAGFFTMMTPIEQNEWVNETLSRIDVPQRLNTYACILDTGVNEAHPLLAPVADSSDMHSYDPNWGTYDSADHGTPMAGLAAYGDLTSLLESPHAPEITHHIESVKVLPNSTDKDNPPELYGAITRESISRVEITPNRNRVFCLAVTTNDYRDRGKPSSWSATIDNLTSGAEDGEKRLIVISAGNTNPAEHINYPDSNYTESTQDPAQSWNALSVGGYTEKIHITDSGLSSYEPLAAAGGLSPYSTTSTTWTRAWPFKPDIVMEAGNVGVDREMDFTSSIDDLELLSTSSNIQETLLINFRETSAATALATRLSAILLAKHPDYWPETLRGLLIHSAEWTEELKKPFNLSTKAGYENLLRFCGYGVPNVEKLLWSTTNSLTLIAQDSLQPFFKEKGAIKTRDINLHELPWPKDILEGLGGTKVEMKVTLSYFIEPNPGQRGWSTKYRYVSHRLQFDVRRPLETVDQFKQRINKKARDDEFDTKNNVKDSGNWLLGSKLRTRGSVHSDTWVGTAVELAARKDIAVFPLKGWWQELKQHERWGENARYSLIVTITTPETDIYTEVSNQVASVVEV